MKVKKSDLVLVGAVLIIVIIGIFSSKGTLTLEPVDYPLQLAGENGLKQITYNEYETLVNNGEAFIVIIERASCSYCQMYMPIVEKVANDKEFPVLYIDTDTLSSEDLNLLSTRNAYLKRNNWGTPTTLLMLGDRVLDSLGGYVEEDKFISFVTDKVVMGNDNNE